MTGLDIFFITVFFGFVILSVFMCCDDVLHEICVAKAEIIAAIKRK